MDCVASLKTKRHERDIESLAPLDSDRLQAGNANAAGPGEPRSKAVELDP